MKKRYYLPIYTRYDSDGDVDGTFYLMQDKHHHQQPQLACDGGSFMGFDERAQFTKKQAIHNVENLCKNKSHYRTVKLVIYMMGIVTKLDRFDRPMASHVADSFFWGWKIVPKKRLIKILTDAHIDVNTNVRAVIQHRMIPCAPYDKKLASYLNKEVKDAESSDADITTASDMDKFIDQCDEEDKKDKLMKAKYFVPRLKKDLEKIKETEH